MIQQLIANVVIAGSVYALFALGFSLIYASTRFFHFAHGAVFTSGAYVTWALASVAGFPLPWAMVAAVCFATLAGILIEIAVYRPLRARSASALVLLMASLGAYVVLQNLISLIFGDDVKTLRGSQVREGYNVAGARITSAQVVIVVTAIVLFVVVAAILARTRAGKALRAVANDPTLALLSGIRSEEVVLFAFAAGSALAGIAGILVALDVDMTPTMGLRALMMGVVAVIIGGVGSISGAVLGALLLSLAQQVGAWEVGTQWQDCAAFIVLVIFLVFRPQGFLGKRVGKATV